MFAGPCFLYVFNAYVTGMYHSPDPPLFQFTSPHSPCLDFVFSFSSIYEKSFSHLWEEVEASKATHNAVNFRETLPFPTGLSREKHKHTKNMQKRELLQPRQRARDCPVCANSFFRGSESDHDLDSMSLNGQLGKWEPGPENRIKKTGWEKSEKGLCLDSETVLKGTA